VLIVISIALVRVVSVSIELVMGHKINVITTMSLSATFTLVPYRTTTIIIKTDIGHNGKNTKQLPLI